MKVPMRPRRERGSRDRGAAAVEFALVVPLLFMLVFGIIDYGRFFFDSISLRQGAREGARQGVVQLYPGTVLGSSTACNTVSTLPAVGARIACSAKAASDNTIGSPKVHINTVSDTWWAQGKQLLVCLASKENGPGFVPFPANGALKTKTYMSIEVDSPVVNPTFVADTDPTGGNWTWCS